jgi:hypothetical protein
MKVIPPKIYEKKSPEEWKAQLLEKWKMLSGKTIEESQSIYLINASHLPWYGSRIFSVESKSEDLPKRFDVAVNISGIHLLSSEKKEVFETFSYSEIEEVFTTAKALEIKFVNQPNEDEKKPVSFITTKAREISILISEYTSYLKHHSQYAKALFDHELPGEGLLAFKKDDVIKIIQRKDKEWLVGEVHGRRGTVNALFLFFSSFHSLISKTPP